MNLTNNIGEAYQFIYKSKCIQAGKKHIIIPNENRMKSIDRTSRSMATLPPLTSRKLAESQFSLTREIIDEPHPPHHLWGRYGWGGIGNEFS